MQLNFLSEYLSITNLVADPINNFTVITGINGAGKTHLLQAILYGNLKLEGVEPAEIVYFNYDRFSIDPKLNITQSQNKINIINPKVN